MVHSIPDGGGRADACDLTHLCEYLIAAIDATQVKSPS